MVQFHRADLRRELRGMSVEPEAVAHGQDALGHPHDGDALSLEMVHHRCDQLLRHRYSSRASPTTISWRLRGRYLIATCAVHRAGSTAPWGEIDHQNHRRNRLIRVVISPDSLAGR